MQNRTQRRLTGPQIILLGFLVLVVAGALLLMLPISSKNREYTPFIDSLFTSVSAGCVTGLIVKDTQTSWSLFGQIVILILIQIGGMGVITMTNFFMLFTGKKIDLRSRTAMQEAVSAPNIGGIAKLTGFIVKGTVLFEALGAVAVMPVFIKDFGFAKGIWYSVFMSISAFCNAGFDLMGSVGECSSLTYYADNPVVNIVFIILILTGGIGFLTWNDIRTYGFKLRKYSTQSKIILVFEAILIIFPALYFYIFELSGEPQGTRILEALFSAVSPRTAGFNTIDYNDFSGVGIAITIMLMLIGGAPGSTAGGMKITTIAILWAAMISVFRREKAPAYFRRRISHDTVYSAVAVFLLDMHLFIGGAIAIALIERLPLMQTMFECASAVATVGLTMGITSSLHIASKIILILIMYGGRVGGLTLVFAATGRKSSLHDKFPTDHIAVG
ncbi:MAG: Trk family potassium uptake protein [Clostridiales bacterium]|nr:Trk family potassium uptake protein [Clostridiales bacterium]